MALGEWLSVQSSRELYQKQNSDLSLYPWSAQHCDGRRAADNGLNMLARSAWYVETPSTEYAPRTTVTNHDPQKPASSSHA